MSLCLLEGDVDSTQVSTGLTMGVRSTKILIAELQRDKFCVPVIPYFLIRPIIATIQLNRPHNNISAKFSAGILSYQPY